VERVRWTDERLDDRMSAIDTSFQRVFDEMRADRDSLRAEMRAGFAEVRSDISALQRQVTAGLCRLRGGAAWCRGRRNRRGLLARLSRESASSACPP
jgi:hypothetical protein